MTSADIRQAFLEFFRSKGHEIVPSAPIVVKNDPSLMFTNAGMNQFKDFFLGNKPAHFKRVADTQKCLRVSGKHNDLEEVGVDTYHHTMFEMLGNWSFGDYFKNEAIDWSWELLTEVYNIPKDRLYATVFEGDTKEGIPASSIALAKWKSLLPGEHIVFGNKKDNFWEMGETGPCGPCSEIHVDCRPDEERKKIPGHTLVNKDHPQVIEIWNNVFIQFNRKKDGSLEPLPATHVDTGMGLERLVRVLQGKTSNYDTDIFTGTIAETEKITGKKYDFSDSKTAIAFRVIADHIRAISFTIADGQLPSNTGAGYVIRRILRRAVRYYYSYLDYKQPLLTQLVPVLAKQFETVFPELHKQVDFVSKVVKEEEESFLRTLERGIVLFNNYTKEAVRRISGSLSGTENVDLQESIDAQVKYFKERKNKMIAGRFAFELNDTFGFPIDLTSLMARELGWSVDIKGFEDALLEQKARSRAATSVDAGDWVELKTGSNKFVGYDSLEAKTEILKYRKVKAKGKESYQLVLETTPYYAESGGQTGDKGLLEIGSSTIEVVDTKKDNDLIIHFTESIPSDLSGEVIAKVDASRRKNTALHHSATHLLHAALRKVLGNHVTQKGSLVNEEHLRFDFSHFAKVTDEEIAAIEALVNEKIRENIPVVIKSMPKEEAMKLGAMALFGEKYGDVVRVVVIDPNYSVELCGGTHVGATGELGLFKLISESAVAAGVRRVEAVCGKQAEEYVNEKFSLLGNIEATLKNSKDVLKTITDLLKDRSELQKTKEQLEKLQAHATLDRLALKKENINSISFYHDIIINVDNNVLKRIYTELEIKERTEKAVVLLFGTNEGKVNVLLGCSQNFKEFDCNKILKEKIIGLINGGGGGQKFLATASGDDNGKFDSITSLIKEMLGNPL